MSFVVDTFIETSGNVVLSSHTGETGATWTLHSSYTGTLQVSDASDNVAQNTGASGIACYYASGAPATSEYDVEYDVMYSSLSSAALEGPAGRISTSANTMYFARYNPSLTRWELYKIVAGSATLLGNYTQTLTTSVNYRCLLQIRSATKKVLIDGVERISSADDAITATGKAGTRWAMQTSNNYNARMDNFYATDVASVTANLYHYMSNQ